MNSLSEIYNEKVRELLPETFASDGQTVEHVRVMIALSDRKAMNYEHDIIRAVINKYDGQYVTSHCKGVFVVEALMHPDRVTNFKNECFELLDTIRQGVEPDLKDVTPERQYLENV